MKFSYKNGPAFFVYFVQGRITKLVKIGFTSNMYTRLASLKTDSADEIDLLCGIPLDSQMQSSAVERYLHRRFGHLKHHGEWYSVDKDLQEYIKGLVTKRGRDVYEEALLWQRNNPPQTAKKYFSKVSDSKLIESIREDYSQGKSLKTIASTHGVSTATVYKLGSGA